MPTEHIVKSFHQELQRLGNLIAQMGGVAEAQVAAAVQSVARRDAELAGRVVRSDDRLDAYEREIEAEAVRLLALRQPMADDLRTIVAALKIATDLERIGDYAANVAKRSIELSHAARLRPAEGIARLGRLVQEILKDVLDAFVERDVAKAVDAWRRDQALDELYAGVSRDVLACMAEDARNIGPCAHLLFMAKNIERIGDHATNVAETVHFIVVGRPLREARPKGDDPSLVAAPALPEAPDGAT